MFNLLRNRRGVALLMTIGILAIMSIIATSFALNMKLELESAANYLRSVKALYLAESGINKVIADIRSQVATSAYASVISYVTGYSTAEQSVDSLGTYQVRIGREIGSVDPNVGEDQKVNLNALDDTDYVWITRLKNAGLTNDDIAEIIDYRDPDTGVVNVTTQICTALGTWEGCTGNETGTKNSLFSSVEEVRLIIGDAKYNNIKNYITIYGPIIRGGLLAEYYDSISGSSPNVQIVKTSFLGKIIELGEIRQAWWANATVFPGADGPWWGWEEAHNAEWAGVYLTEIGWDYSPYTFGVIFEGYIEVMPGEVGSSVTFYLRADDGTKLFIDGTNVINAWYDRAMDPDVTGTYTFNYAGWHPIRLEYYENGGSNGCTLKWSLAGAEDFEPDTKGAGNYVPAERLGFHPIITHPREPAISYPSAGSYNITSVGKVKTTDGTVLAEKKVTAAVKIFGVWTQTTREDFYAAWFSDPGTKTGLVWAEEYYVGNFSDGEIFNVNWLNNCPNNASSDLEAGGFGTTVNALKLGYWNDFQEDQAYSMVTLTAMARKRLEGTNRDKKEWEVYGPTGDYNWVAYRVNGDVANPNYFAVSYTPSAYSCIEKIDSNYRLKIDTPVYEELYFEVNFNYYRPVNNIFARVWTSCSEYPSHRVGWRGNAAAAEPPSGAVKFRDFWSDPDPAMWFYNHHFYNTDGDEPPVWDHWVDLNGDGIYTAGIDTPAEPAPVYRVRKIFGTGPDINNDTQTYIYGNYKGPYLKDNNGDGIFTPGIDEYVDYDIAVDYDPDPGVSRHVAPYESPPTSDASGAYWQPVASFLVPFLYGRGERKDYYEQWAPDSCGVGFYTEVFDEDGWVFPAGDALEIALATWFTAPREYLYIAPDVYKKSNVLAMIKGASSTYYKTYLDSGPKIVEKEPQLGASLEVPNFKFKSNNAYELNWYRYQAIRIRGATVDAITTYFDNIRFIPDNGYLVSTPFYAGEGVTWGWLNWTEGDPADLSLDVTVGIRTADSGLPSTNTGWSSVSNGTSITSSGKWLQYKATLSTTALNKDNYISSGKTPIFKDITITYLPRVEVLYFREVTE